MGRDERQALEMFMEVCGGSQSSGRLVRAPSIELTDPPDWRPSIPYPSTRVKPINHINNQLIHPHRSTKPIMSTTTHSQVAYAVEAKGPEKIAALYEAALLYTAGACSVGWCD